jgi:hypothetical protein
MHRYILEPYKSPSSRYRCPGCNKPHIFALYIDVETNNPIDDRVGRCNREIECGYHYPPKAYFDDNGISVEHTPYLPSSPKPQPPTSYLDPEIFKKSLTAYSSNNFVKFLHTIFDQSTVEGLIKKYLVGTSSHWPGATVFWQVDETARIRTGKVMLYNSETGKRVKEPYSHLTWSHKVLKLPNFNLKLCLFGAHLLDREPCKPVAIVESEKTAMIASVYLPQYIWLAVGGLSQLTSERCRILKGRTVILYPDLNAYDKWHAKGTEFGFKTSNILENKATKEEISLGLDIADYLIRVNIKKLTTISGDLSDLNAKVIQTPSLPDFNQTEAVTVKSNIREIRPDILELHTAHTAAEQSGKLDQHPDKYFIAFLWACVLKYYHTPQLNYYVEQLKRFDLSEPFPLDMSS